MARKEEEAARQIRVKFTQKINLTPFPITQEDSLRKERRHFWQKIPFLRYLTYLWNSECAITSRILRWISVAGVDQSPRMPGSFPRSSNLSSDHDPHRFLDLGRLAIRVCAGRRSCRTAVLPHRRLAAR
ncbi:hypothetical protein HZS91_04733 [Xanthomonas citri pv. citri]|nr:hypothetical protein HZS91_04733 [Xanthomonas citri pv. citri]CEE43556.1 hypothetical protein XAC9322_820004 [Xanthomonas citri pv. citri]CEE44291.1 hypothetical protein XAC1083_860004 [Xanthomonas citri pv. citri]CEE59403.1 hypothetical protein XAC3608_1590004 [Xanthomonas citri pv. citri]CEF47928.1 hypothetical protein XAC217_930004 [Xanthomonas citri pv. citri]